MSTHEQIPGPIKRFILTSIASVPHLEAILLLRYDPKVGWDVKTMAERLYIDEKRTQAVLNDLCASGFAFQNQEIYTYEPVSERLRKTLDELSVIYAQNIIEVTHLIHSKLDKQAQQFGDAFKWQNEKEQ